MRGETIEKITRHLDRLCQALGFIDYDACVQTTIEVAHADPERFRALASGTIGPAWDAAVQTFARPDETALDCIVRILLKPITILRAQEEPSQETFQLYLDLLSSWPMMLRKALNERCDQLPAGPRGRGQLYSRQEKVIMCEEIGKLLATGLNLIGAQKKIAAREGCSLRTVQRIWQARKKLMPPLPQ